MDHFELHESAQYIADTHSGYTLAKAWLQCDEKLKDALERCSKLHENQDYLVEQLAEYQRIYGSLDQSDYLRRTL